MLRRLGLTRVSILTMAALLCAIHSVAQSGTGTAAASSTAVSVTGSVVPHLIKFSGVLSTPTQSEPSKSPLRSVGLTFSLYELQEGGSPLWSERQTVQLDSVGRYAVLLGATEAEGLPLDLFTSGKALWLGVQPELPGAAEQPRVLLVAVPYALKASDSDTLGGKPASAYALAGTAPLTAVVAGGVQARSGSETQEPTTENAVPSSTPQPAAACSGVTSDGTVTANWVAKFTAACNIQKSLIFDTGTNVGVGTSAPVAFLDSQSTITATASGFNYGFRTLTTANPAATSSSSIFGLFANAQTATGNAQNMFNIYGMDFRTDHYGTGSVNGAYGGFGAVLNDKTGTIGNAFGLYTYLSNVSTGKITNAYGLYLAAPLNGGGGTFSNYTGVYIANPTAAVPGAYGLYSGGGTNYFGGNVGIGTTTPVAKLEVNGTSRFDSSVTVTGLTAGNCVQAGAGGLLTTTAAPCGSGGGGGGTVTSVAAGVGIIASPSPITTAGTISINTSVVPQLGTANTFTADQTLNAALDLVQTTGADAGVINLGGSPFIHACCPTSTQNTFVGTNAGNFTANDSDFGHLGQNTAVGYQSMQGLTSGFGNTAGGYQALYSNTTGFYNTASGYQALYADTQGDDNTATGYQTLYSNLTGFDNTASGYGSLYSNTTGFSDSGSGFQTLYYNTTGNYNTATGNAALLQNTTGSNNTAVGTFAGRTNTTGNSNTFVGFNADAGSDALSNSTAIGAFAAVTASNALTLGAPVGAGSGQMTANTKVGIDVGNPSNIFTVLQGGGHAIADGWDTYSSRRWKSNIHTLHGALGKVEQLRGVEYNYTANGHHDIGMIAEEVSKVVPEVVSYADNGKDARGIDYARLTALLVEAVKQQQVEIKQQQLKVQRQKSEIRTLEARIRRLEAAKPAAVFVPVREVEAVKKNAK